MLGREAGEILGAEIGEVLAVDEDDNVSDAGCFLRVKVRIYIRKLLMRGVTISGENGGKDRWCPLMYEFLPDFSYVCGIIGRTKN